MSIRTRVFVTDCEGPISKNDNAYELTSRFIPEGDNFFSLVSHYDDVLADVVKEPEYKAGDTLKLILPFMRAYGATNAKIRKYSAKNILLMHGAKETLDFARKIMPTFIVSTSYEHYISAVCEAIVFPMENTYCTRLNIDRYQLGSKEKNRLIALRKEISNLAPIKIPIDAKSFSDLPLSSQSTVSRLNRIFREEINCFEVSSKIISEVNPIGGYEKANALEDIAQKTCAELSEMVYVGDSITDVEPFRAIRKAGGLTISFNGNQYALREAEIAVMSYHTIVLSYLAEQYNRLGKEHVLSLVSNWKKEIPQKSCSPEIIEIMKDLRQEMTTQVEIITDENLEHLIAASSSFRKTVRGKEIGKLG